MNRRSYISRPGFTLVAITLICGSARAQTFNGDLTLSSQAEVNAFNYTEVTGDLTISGADITDLSTLSVLTTVGDNFLLQNNSALTTVTNGFASLTSVGQYMGVSDNTSLQSFSGFGALATTGDNLDIYNNTLLESLSGFGALQTVGHSLEIFANSALTQLPDYASLTTINSSLFIYNNAALTDITGFSALASVGWSFNITGNTSLDGIEGFENYFVANNPYPGGGTFIIEDNGLLLADAYTVEDALKSVPEPGSLTALGIAGLLLTRRRRRSAA